MEPSIDKNPQQPRPYHVFSCREDGLNMRCGCNVSREQDFLSRSKPCISLKDIASPCVIFTLSNKNFFKGLSCNLYVNLA